MKKKTYFFDIFALIVGIILMVITMTSLKGCTMPEDFTRYDILSSLGQLLLPVISGGAGLFCIVEAIRSMKEKTVHSEEVEKDRNENEEVK